MEKQNVISDELMKEIESQVKSNHNWIAYNSINYFLEKGDVFFFKNKDEADEFCMNNIGDYQNFQTIYAPTSDIAYQKIVYGEDLLLLNKMIASPLKNTIMNQENLKYLQDNLKYLGFGDKLYADLEINLKAQKPEFTLSYNSELNKQTLDATLYLKKSDTTDMYFFNKYDFNLKKNEDKAADLQQTFYVTKGQGITLKEAFNLLNGRAVHKELTPKVGDNYKAWIQLDLTQKDEKGNFKRQQFHENYGYDVKKELQKLPVSDNNAEKEEKLIKSVQKGNLQAVDIKLEGKEARIFVEANPQYKTLNLYDANMKRLTNEQKQEILVSPSESLSQKKTEGVTNSAKEMDKAESKAAKEEIKEAKGLDDKMTEKAAKKSPKKEAVEGLMPKKNVRPGKGLSM
jgi:hypothetical protein